jgi:uncharacterized membrane protein
MTIFEKILLTAAGFSILFGMIDDSDWFGWLLPIVIIFIVYKFFSSMSKNAQDTSQGESLSETGEMNKVSTGIRFERLVSLLVKKGVVDQDELSRAGIFVPPLMFVEKKELPVIQRAVQENTPSHTETTEWSLEKQKEILRDAPTFEKHEMSATSPVTVSENIPVFVSTEEREEELKKESTEFQISGNMLVWVGVFAVLLGVGFFLKYAIEKEIPGFGPTGRVVMGIFSGFIFLGIGEFLHTKYEKYANMLAGAGIGLLYLSFFGMFYYKIGNDIVTLFFMGLVTAVSLTLSTRYESRGIAVLGLIGGYGTPIFFGEIATGLGGFVLLNYLVVLNIGVLTLAYFKNWSWAVWSGFVGTAVLMTGWLASPNLYDPSKITTAISYLTIFWLLFTFATLIFYYFHDRIPKQSDAILMVVIGLQYAATVYGLLIQVFDKKEAFFGLIPLVLAFVYTGIAYLGVSFRSTERSLALYPLGMAVLFLTLIFPFEFDGKWLTVAWLCESAVLGFMALMLRSFSLAKFAMPVYSLGILFLFIDMPSKTKDMKPILNEQFFLYAVAIVSAFCIMYTFVKLRKYQEAETKEVGGTEVSKEMVFEEEEENPFAKGIFIFVNILIGILVLNELWIFSRFLDVGSHVFYSVFNIRFLLLLMVLIYAYGVIFFDLGRKGEKSQFESRVKIAFIIANILVIISGWLELYDYGRFLDFAKDYVAILNARTLIFAVLMTYTGVVSYYLYKGIPGLFSPVLSVSKGMFFAFNLLFLWWGIVEVSDFHRYLGLNPETYTSVFNIRTIILLIGITYTGAMSYFFKQRAKNNPDLITWPSMFFVGTNVFIAVWALFEFSGYYSHLAIYTPMFNVRAFVLFLMIGYTAVVSFMFYDREDKSGGTTGAGYFVSASVLMLFWGLLEIIDYHNRILIKPGMDFAARDLITQQMSMYISIFLVSYGFISLIIGLVSRFALLRKISIIVLGIAIIKVFFYDIGSLSELGKIIAFLSLGITLLVVGYLSYRYKDRLGSITGFNEQKNETK